MRPCSAPEAQCSSCCCRCQEGSLRSVPPSRPCPPLRAPSERSAKPTSDVISSPWPRPAMRGREGGTLDEMRASIWVAEQYRRIGLEPAGDDGTWFQWFDMTRTRVSVTASRASIAGQALTLFRRLHPA